MIPNNNIAVVNNGNCNISERPILFSGAMVQAILDGRKQQTRRIIKPQPELCHGCQSCEFRCDHLLTPIKCPYGKVGDKLWCREAWRQLDGDCAVQGEHRKAGAYSWKAEYRGDSWKMYRWKSPIHMPRKACRLVLEVKDIRVERLQDISKEDAIAEGIEGQSERPGAFKSYKDYETGDFVLRARTSFRSLWISINGADSWESNLFVWVVEFKRVGGAL